MLSYPIRLLLLVAWCAGIGIAAGSSDELKDSPSGEPELAWPTIQSEHRPGCFWWWPGSAVDKANLTWNLEQLHAAGLGGVHVIPIYGVKGEESRSIEYLSPAWLDMLDHAAAEAERLGMWIDMTTGTGWPFGGPTVSDDDADLVATYLDGKIETRIGRQVKRAAPGGAGNSVNPYSSDALRSYLKRFDRAMADYQGKVPRAQFHDSFEYAGNWSRSLFDQFKARRGYDLRDHLRELFVEGDYEVVARVKSDYRQTLAELHLEFVETWARWAKEKGCQTRNQAHGAPANLLDVYAASDIPETEVFGASPLPIPGLRRDPWNTRLGGNSAPMVCRFASSAAHVTGRPLVSSETCTWLRNHFTTSLSQIKPEVDQLFTLGINHIVYHGSCYSPQDAKWPGWLFYAAIEFNPRNAFWQDVPALNEYVARCQSIMQSGQPDNDILLYWPICDIWHDPWDTAKMFTTQLPLWLDNQPCGYLARDLVKRGYTFDFVSDRQLQAVRAESGSLAAPGARYKVVLVPRCGHMPVGTWRQLVALAEGGATVLVHEALPADVPGYGNLPRRRRQFREVTERVSLGPVAGSAIRRARIGSGQILVGDDLDELFASADVPREQLSELGIAFARRTHASGRHYFVANLGDRAVDQWVGLGTPCEAVVIMEPLSGTTGLGRVRQRDGRTEVYLQLAPGESRILRTFERTIEGPAWQYLKPAGRPLKINGQWQIEFVEGGPVLPGPLSTSELASWTTLGGRNAQRFAGTARYSIEFELPARDCDDWVLDLGDVRESAAVRINGQAIGTLWSIPFRAAVGRHLRRGKNRLEIDVTNLSANRLRDLDRRGVAWRIFHDINFVTHDYRPFDASEWPLMDSGLLGPMLLRPMKHQ